MYTTVSAVRKAITRERLENALPSVSSAYIQNKINAATAEIDSRLIKWYDIPLLTDGLTTEQLDNVNAMLGDWCINIVLHSIMAPAAADVPKGIQIAYDRTQSRMKDVDKGVYALPYVIPRTRVAFRIIGDVEDALTDNIFQRARRV